MAKALIIDSSNLIFRSYFAYPHLSKGESPTGAFYGFAKSVIKMVKDYNPEYIFFTKDLPTPTWRHKILDSYKQGRKEPEMEMIQQIPVIHNWCQMITPNVFEADGYEADDLIKTVVEILEKNSDIECNYIFSSDRDLYQLFDNKKIVFIHGDKLFSKSDFIEKYQVRPDQWVDFKTLVGDASDNLKGINGIGPKGASDLLNKINNLDNILNYLEKNQVSPEMEEFLKNPKSQLIVEKIKQNKDKLKQTYELSKLKTVDNIQLEYTKPDFSKGSDIFHQYGFSSLLKELSSLKNYIKNDLTDDSALTLF
jgi:DNA polymerase I